MLKLSRSSSKISTTPRIYSETSVTFSLLGAALYPEEISEPEPLSTILRHLLLQGLYHFEVLIASESSILRDPLCSEGFSSEPEAPTTDHSLSLLTVMQLYPFTTFITCNVPINASSYEQ